MDELVFIIEENKPEPENSWRDCKTVKILINNIDLVEMLKKHELPFAKNEGDENKAGGYAGLTPERLLENLTYPDFSDLEYSWKVTILGCVCGAEGCWPMRVEMSIEKGKVLWTNFEQPFRRAELNVHWDYSAFGPFEFNEIDYNEQLAKLKQSIDG